MLSDIIVILFLMLFIFFGYKSGFIKTLYETLSYVLSIYVAYKIFPFFSDFLYKTKLSEILNNYFSEKLADNFDTSSVIFKLFSFYQEKGADAFSKIIISIISFVLLIFASKLILYVAYKSLNIFSKLPVVSSINSLLGALLGILKGIVVLYIVFALINIFPFKYTDIIIKNVNESKITYKLYNENIILDLIGKDIVNNNE